MNKKLFLFLILGLVLIPTVLAIPEILTDALDLIKNSTLFKDGLDFSRDIAYVRFAFALLIGFLIYELLSKLKVSERMSLVVSGFIGIISVLMVPASLLQAAATSYSVILWSILLTIPIAIVSFLIYNLPEGKLFRIVKIGLLFFLAYVISFVADGLMSAFASIINFGEPVKFLASLATWAIVVSICYQCYQLFKEWRSGKEPASTPTENTIPQSQPSNQEIAYPFVKEALTQQEQIHQGDVEGARAPLIQEAAQQREKKKKYKKQLKEFKKASKEQRKQLNRRVDDLSKELEEVRSQLQHSHLESQTPEVQQDIQDGRAVQNKTVQETTTTLEELSSNLQQEIKACEQTIQVSKEELSMYEKWKGQESNPEQKESYNSLATMVKQRLELENGLLDDLKRQLTNISQQTQDLQKSGTINPEELDASEVALERKEESEEELEKIEKELQKQAMKHLEDQGKLSKEETETEMRFKSKEEAQQLEAEGKIKPWIPGETSRNNLEERNQNLVARYDSLRNSNLTDDLHRQLTKVYNLLSNLQSYEDLDLVEETISKIESQINSKKSPAQESVGDIDEALERF
jgi:hypothetical protein